MDDKTTVTTLTTDMEETDWFGSLGADFKSIATFFQDTAQPVVGGVASLVQQTALSVAAEIADWEREQQESNAWQGLGESISSIDDQRPLLLPWEVRKWSDDDHEKKSMIVLEDEELRKDIMNLSSNESTFLEPFTSFTDSNPNEERFTLDDNRISLIQRLFEADESLVAAHTRISGRKGFNELVFWKNYFFNCQKLRCKKIGDLTMSHTCLESDAVLALGVQDDGNTLPLSEHDGPQVISETTKDDDSFVRIASAPNSLNTIISTKSLEDMVLVRSDSHLGK
ncbi:unnamed protein product [Cylindrotheca closterium]|uniref:BSD domain-containing protein n=1 Tax=Cylindrotheca closterium TaxID=2856 RepID=A0AAD2JPS1_9STRA|nr:unnamed protein product [Cylindrotheca closterium]